MKISTSLSYAFAACILTQAAPTTVQRDGITYNVIEDRSTNTSVHYIKNSGVCETTPGVQQVSGYLNIGSDVEMFFWFFESRKDPKKAPLALWINGGPGCSSMIGLFQENGPCRFEINGTEPIHNPYSWNEYANMLYVDQPVGVGFSSGDETIFSTVDAAPPVWALLQAFFEEFPSYKSRDFGIFTESYGGHYGPEFSNYIQSKNTEIHRNKTIGEKINLVALGINNGNVDPTIQNKAYITYAATNKYNKLINSTQAKAYYGIYDTVCLPRLLKCNTTDPTQQAEACVDAAIYCSNDIEYAIEGQLDFDPYDVRQPLEDPYPPTAYIDYLNREDIQKRIGAKPTTYEECNYSTLFDYEYYYGDGARSFLPTLSKIVKSGVQVLLWAGDADYQCNYMGYYKVAEAIDYQHQTSFNEVELEEYTVNGECQGLFKAKGKLSWLQVYGAGHKVPYYNPELSLQVFKQTLDQKIIFTT